MEKVNLAEMADFLVNLESSPFSNEASALNFLISVSAVVDREASETKSPQEVHINIHNVESSPTLTLGLVPKERFFDVTSVSTAMPPSSVARVISSLDDKFLRKPLLGTGHLEALQVEGFGTFENRGSELVFKPLAFEYLRKTAA